jgi:hypothetical protein
MYGAQISGTAKSARVLNELQKFAMVVQSQPSLMTPISQAT